MVREHRGEYPSLWAAIESIAPKIGCVAQTLHEWVKRDQIDTGARDGVTTSEREHMEALERENKELRKANELLKLASAFFAQVHIPFHRDRTFRHRDQRSGRWCNIHSVISSTTETELACRFQVLEFFNQAPARPP
jgi:transposase-like protein